MKIKINNVFKKKNVDDKGQVKSKEEYIDKDSKKGKNMSRYFANLFINKNKISKSYYLLLILMISLGGASMYLVSKTYNIFSKESFDVYNSNDSELDVFANNQENKDTIEQNILSNNSDTKNNSSPNNSSGTIKNDVIQAPKVEPLKFSKPLSGDILKPYSKDKLVYSKTLELWKTHDGIDIKAENMQNVKSIEKGRVEKVYEDSFYGVTVVIDHGQGYKSSYSNLDKNVLVKEKQIIAKGKVIGKVSKSAIGEIKDDYHLHFTLLKDGSITDPTYIFD